MGGGPTDGAPYLGYALEVEREHVLPAPRLALPDQEHAVGSGALQLNQLRRFHAGDGAVEPGVAGQEVVRLLAGGVQQAERSACWRRWAAVSPCGCLTSRAKAEPHSPWFRESVLPRGELAGPGPGAEGRCVSGSVLCSLPVKRLRLGVWETRGSSERRARTHPGGLTLGLCTPGAQPSTNSAAAHRPPQR